jgi:hypothetical protein
MRFDLEDEPIGGGQEESNEIGMQRLGKLLANQPSGSAGVEVTPEEAGGVEEAAHLSESHFDRVELLAFAIFVEPEVFELLVLEEDVEAEEAHGADEGHGRRVVSSCGGERGQLDPRDGQAVGEGDDEESNQGRDEPESLAPSDVVTAIPE